MIAGFGELGEALRRSTVQIRNRRGSGGGSGVVWNANGLIVTNAHVIGRAEAASVELWDGRTFEAEVKARDERRDLASLRIHAGQLQPATIGDSSRLRAGELVIAVGNPLGFTGAMSTGVIHAAGPMNGLGRRTWVQAGIRLAPGNSGGPLADSLGRVIGINTMIVSGGLALAVPVNTVRAFIDAGPSAGLGVTVRPVRVPQRRKLGLLVLEVNPGGPADAASLMAGDILTGADGTDFSAIDDLSDAIERSAGRLLALRFMRGGLDRTREVRVDLAWKVAA